MNGALGIFVNTHEPVRVGRRETGHGYIGPYKIQIFSTFPLANNTMSVGSVESYIDISLINGINSLRCKIRAVRNRDTCCRSPEHCRPGNFWYFQ